jgi:hypothetical protein
VVNDPLLAKQAVPDLDQASPQRMMGDLGRVAQEAKNTVDSINRAIELANKARDGADHPHKGGGEVRRLTHGCGRRHG